jgi:hypothetical protein
VERVHRALARIGKSKFGELPPKSGSITKMRRARPMRLMDELPHASDVFFPHALAGMQSHQASAMPTKQPAGRNGSFPA